MKTYEDKTNKALIQIKEICINMDTTNSNEDLREYLLNCGFKFVDMDFNGNEVFQMDKFKFSVREMS